MENPKGPYLSILNPDVGKFGGIFETLVLHFIWDAGLTFECTSLTKESRRTHSSHFNGAKTLIKSHLNFNKVYFFV